MPKIVADEQVFQATRQVVIERGYTGATTKQIAEMAHISEVTLFRKYGSKAELTRRAIEAMASEIDFETAAQYTGDVTADLQRVVQLYQEMADKHGQFFYLLLAEIPRHPELAALVNCLLG
jgi:AcrR family transcriptional regulator